MLRRWRWGNGPSARDSIARPIGLGRWTITHFVLPFLLAIGFGFFQRSLHGFGPTLTHLALIKFFR